MHAAEILVFATLVLNPAFAQTDWKEFTNSDGNFRVLFPTAPQETTGTERNLHVFSATIGAEFYALAYADESPNSDCEAAINNERDSIVQGRSGAVTDQRRTSVEGYPGEWVSFVGRDVIGEIAVYCVGHRVYFLQAIAPKSEPRPVNFSTFLNSFRLLSKTKPEQASRDGSSAGETVLFF